MAKKKPREKGDQSTLQRFTPGKVELVGDISLPKKTRQPKIPIKPPRVRRVVAILRSQEMIGKIRELVENGASLSTVDAIMHFPPNTLSNMLTKGRTATSKSDPYYRFLMMFRGWAGLARAQAEVMLAKKSPEKWLDRNSSNKIIATEEDNKLAAEAPSNNAIIVKPVAGVNLETIERSLAILREQGIDINDAIDKGEFKLYTAEDNDD